MIIISCVQSISVGRDDWEAVGSREGEGSDGAHQPGLWAATPSPFPVCFCLVGFS